LEQGVIPCQVFYPFNARNHQQQEKHDCCHAYAHQLETFPQHMSQWLRVNLRVNLYLPQFKIEVFSID